ncbi:MULTISPECIES: hypothetical protein [unclassified Paraburkholderia]|uniref:hypothetical protein n=1 Tax=unclassified Paraburkholderia TaxID=2615204 RepID=UPI002AAF1111|nr:MULTISPECIES: hypothetical protein [unclassified Paraburkholderia]
MTTRILLALLLIVATMGRASAAEEVKRVCRNVWKHDHYEEKCHTVRRAPPPAPRIDAPPPPPNSKKDGPQSGPLKHPRQPKEPKDVQPVSVKRPASI